MLDDDNRIKNETPQAAPGQGPTAGVTPPVNLSFWKLRKKRILIAIVGLTLVGLTIGYYALASSFKSAKQATLTPSPASSPLATPEPSESPAAQPEASKSPTPTPTPAPTPSPTPTPVHCAGGHYISSVGKTSCSFSFQVDQVPARFTSASIQISPRASLYDHVSVTAACVAENACEKVAGGAVTTETGAYIDWKITKATQIAITGAEVQPGFTLQSLEYDHAAEPICTADHWYCYTLSVNYAAQ